MIWETVSGPARRLARICRRLGVASANMASASRSATSWCSGVIGASGRGGLGIGLVLKSTCGSRDGTGGAPTSGPVGIYPAGVTYSAAEARQTLLDAMVDAADDIALALAHLGEA